MYWTAEVSVGTRLKAVNLAQRAGLGSARSGEKCDAPRSSPHGLRWCAELDSAQFCKLIRLANRRRELTASFTRNSTER
jgi:hypothetical protein